MKIRIKKYIKAAFRSLGFQITRVPGVITQTPKFWDNQDDFNALYEDIREHTIVSKNRLFMLYQILRYAINLDGDIAEVGVYNGGTAKLIALAAPYKNIYLFDTFSGMPAICTEIDTYKGRECCDVSLKSVKSFLRDCANVTFYQGIFPDSASPIKDKKFSLVHIDVDIYKSVKGCLEFFYDRVVSKGVIVIDDYESWACPGVKKAVSDFLAEKKEIPIITTEIQCIIIKL